MSRTTKPSTDAPASSGDLWASLSAPIWKVFRLDTGCYLLHVPSSHLLEVERAVLDHVEGIRLDADIAHELASFADNMKQASTPAIKTDIRSISLNMAQGCNLRCTYCFAGEGDYGSKGMMSLATAQATLEFFGRGREQLEVIFFGGEPLLNFAVIKGLVEWCETQSCKFIFKITSNGTLMTKERLQWLKDKKFAITWSYDGPGLQDRQRLLADKSSGSGAMIERKLASLAESLKDLRAFRLRTTVTRANLDHLEESILSTLTSKNYRLAVARHASKTPQHMFTADDIAKLEAIYTSVVNRFLSLGDYKRVLAIGNLRERMRAIHHGETGQMACAAGVHYLSVSVSGKFYLCHRFTEDESENYGDLEHGLDYERLATIRHARQKPAAACGSCWMRQWCAGGCFHEHKLATGDKFQLDPQFCQLQDLETKLAIRVYTALQLAAPELIEQELA